MLKLYPAHIIAGLTVYEDDSNATVFYVMPDEPNFRTDPNTGKFVLNFIKYLMPVDRPDGSKGGGFLIFDSTFTIDPGKLSAIQADRDQYLKSQFPVASGQKPPTAQISMPTFTKGTSQLVLLDSGGALVTKIEAAGKPSLTGSMICSFTAELSPEGAAVVEAAMQGKGGIVQIMYDLTYTAALPPVTGHVWFDAFKFASFSQTIDKSGGSWDSGDNTENETMREAFVNSQSGGVDFDFTGLPTGDPTVSKLHDDLVNWGWQQLNTAVQSVLASQSSSSGGGSSSSSGGGGVTGSNTGADLGSDKSDDGMEHVTRDETSWSYFSFDEWYRERDAIAMETVQQGTLPNPPNFEQYAETINANDPFFSQVHATVYVNADFAKFNINSVDVNCIYPKTTPPTVSSGPGGHFTTADNVLKFDSNTSGGDMNYQYGFTVNYLDAPAPFVSPQYTTTNSVVTLDVGSLGTFFLNLNVTNIDWTTVKQVQVSVTYPDKDATGAGISRSFGFDANNRTASMVVLVLKPIDKQYTYTVTYVLNDGTQIVKGPLQDNTQNLFINNIFVPKVVTFIAEGDFANQIDNIFLRMTYSDAANKYTQSGEYQFSAQNRTHDWSFPTVPGAQGQVSYVGVISYKNNTQQNIPSTTSNSSLIAFGPPDQTIITVTPDPALIDWTQVKLIQVEFQYSDPANNLSMQQEIVLKQSGATPAAWTFYTKDPNKVAYTYTATYYMASPPNSVIKGTPATTADTDLVLPMPAPAPTT